MLFCLSTPLITKDGLTHTDHHHQALPTALCLTCYVHTYVLLTHLEGMLVVHILQPLLYLLEL